MLKRKKTQKKIEMNCFRLKEAAKTAKSIKDLEKATGLSYTMIKTTLSKHPIIFNRIREQLVANRLNVSYLKKSKPVIIPQSTCPTDSIVCTMFFANKYGNKLILSLSQKFFTSICIYSNGVEYTNGNIELHIGDDIYIATKKPQYITFAHYQMISLDLENNCKLIFHCRIYNGDNNKLNLLKPSYKSFVKDFICRHNI